MATKLIDLLLPQRCVACGVGGVQLCEPCRGRIRYLSAPMCARCGAPTAWPVARCRECTGRRLAFAQARAAVVYDDTVRSVVSAWKERGLRRLATVAGELVAAVMTAPAATAITFVPSDGDRSLTRGHHPAERLAVELGIRWELSVHPLLARSRGVRRQRGLSLAARRRNVRGVFRPVGRAPPRVILVDDVYTSGATANAAASALRSAGARRVEVVTFARAVR